MKEDNIMNDPVKTLISSLDEVMELYCIPSDERPFLLEGIDNGQFVERLDEIFELYCVQAEEREPLLNAYRAAKPA